MKIFVGPKEQKWVVHQNVICEKSLWFQRVFTCDLFETSRTKSIFLGKHGIDVNSKTFECFVDWVPCPAYPTRWIGTALPFFLKLWGGLASTPIACVPAVS